MNDLAASILTILTILGLISFCAFMNAKLRELKPMLVPRLIKSLLTWSLSPIMEIENKAFCLFYLMSLACYAKIFALLRQFRIGRMYIKIEWAFWSDFVLWVLTPIFIALIISHYEKELKHKNNETK